MFRLKLITAVILILLLSSCAKSEPIDEDFKETTTVVYNTNYATPSYKYSLMYNYLTEPEKLVYREIYSGLKSRATAITITGVLKPEQFERVYKIVAAQEVEFYDLGNTMEYSVLKRTGCVNALYVSYTKDEQAKHIAGICIDGVVERVKEEIGTITDKRVKVRKIHNYIITSTVYDEGAIDASNICGVFVEGRATCAGYAKAFKYLCDLYEIPCVVVTGEADGSHMWNYVQIGEKWYGVDTTWDDADTEDDMLIYQDYCLIDINKMEENHTVDKEYSIFLE